MPRYIDADELWLQLDKRKLFEQGRNHAYYKGLRDATKDLEDTPTADVVERKKGKWIDRSAYCVCNLCGHTEQQFNGVELIPRHTPFCATCGAEMEEPDGE